MNNILARGNRIVRLGSSKRLFGRATSQHVIYGPCTTNEPRGTSDNFPPGRVNCHIVQTRCTHNKPTLEDFLEIKVEENDTETRVDVVPKETGREGLVVNSPPCHDESCALCRLNLVNIHYTDVKILAQFIKPDGTMAEPSEARICGAQYRKIKNLIKKAQRCNLIRRPADYFVPGQWHELNTYLEPDRQRDVPRKIIKKEYWRT